MNQNKIYINMFENNIPITRHVFNSIQPYMIYSVTYRYSTVGHVLPCHCSWSQLVTCRIFEIIPSFLLGDSCMLLVISSCRNQSCHNTRTPTVRYVIYYKANTIHRYESRKLIWLVEKSQEFSQSIDMNITLNPVMSSCHVPSCTEMSYIVLALWCHKKMFEYTKFDLCDLDQLTLNIGHAIVWFFQNKLNSLYVNRY